MIPRCPDKSRLRDFLEGKICSIDADELSEHINACSACSQLVESLEDPQGEVILQVREGIRLEKLLNEPELHQLRHATRLPTTEIVEEPAMDNHVKGGKWLRDYRLVRKIGEGGMGTVYQAVHVHLGKSVALKILPTDKLRSKNAVKRFKQEMRSVGKVNHPNVVRASDAGTIDGQHFLVMELVVGADLARVIRDRGSLKVADACEIVRQAAVGLQHAHEIGLVHRDVKPSNLMLGIDGSVRVLDLGLAGLNQSEFEPTANIIVADRLTSVGQIMGTLDYMAPEQITASTHVDGRADVYALGATLFQLLTKKTPCGHRSSDASERIEAVLQEPPTEIRTLRSDVPNELSALLQTMLAKSPQDRPQSASEVADKLSPFTDDADLITLADAYKTSLDLPSADVDITDDVSLVVSHANAQLESKPVGQSRTQRAWPRYVPAIGLAMLALIVGTLLSVFTFQTKFGTVAVELPLGADATNVRVALEQDGETVSVMEPSGRWKVDVEAGQYRTKLLSGTEQFELVGGVLTVKSGERSIVRIRRVTPEAKPKPSIEELFRIGHYRQAAEAAEREAKRDPNEESNHGRAAVMWLFISLQDPSDEHAGQRYDDHRRWLAERWARTGRSRSIPRVCCMRGDPPGDLPRMLDAIVAEAERYPGEAWQYAHSRMLVLYRLRRYEEALALFPQCRQLAPHNQMRAAVDHLWAANIQYRLGQIAQADDSFRKGVKLLNDAGPRDGQRLTSKFFDFIESHAALEEANQILLQQARVPQSIPYSLCTADFRLKKWRSLSEEIMSAALSENETTAAFALGWRPGTWEAWDLSSVDEPHLVFDEEKVVRHVGGQPIRSVGLHPDGKIAALGRWYGTVDVVEVAGNRLLATRETSEGKYRKANRVQFVDDGHHLLIGYQSTRLVDWHWGKDETVAQQVMPHPVWNFDVAGDQILHRGRIWNRQNGLLQTLAENADGSRFFEDGRKAIVLFGATAHVVDVTSGDVLSIIEFPDAISGVAFLPQEKRMITGHDDGQLRLVDLESGRHIPLGRIHDRCAAKIATHDCKNILLTTTGKRTGGGKAPDHQVAIWSLSDRLETQPLDQIQSHPDEIERRRSDVRAAILGVTQDVP